MTEKPLTVGGVLYPGFEMLDLFGPLEMYSALGSERIRIVTVAQGDDPVAAAISVDVGIGPRVMPDFNFDNCPQLDIVVLPGGFGTVPELENDHLLSFLARQATGARVISSVCTGSALLARAGVLDGRRATSNKQFFVLATSQPGDVDWIEQARWVEDGKFFTSSGVSAGMDMSLAVITRLFGEEAAENSARVAEYTWHRDADSDPFAADLNEAARAMGLL